MSSSFDQKDILIAYEQFRFSFSLTVSPMNTIVFGFSLIKLRSRFVHTLKIERT